MKEFWSNRIAGIVPYTPGEQPKNRTFIKLNTNENPFGPSPAVIKAILAEANDSLRLYPDPDATQLRLSAARLYGITPDEVFVGNGSDEVLAFAFQAFFDQGKTIAFADITYSFYPVYADLFGIPYDRIPLCDDFSLPVEKYCTGAYAGLVICNPNAPTGIQLPLDDIRRIIEANPDVVVLVDEAYVGFGGESALPMIREYPNLLVVQTLSKDRSLAGMRIGMAFGNPNLIAGLNAVKNSFNSYTLDRLAIAAGSAALDDIAYFDATRHAVMEARAYTTQQLRALGFLVHESHSNFVFATHPSAPASILQQALRDEGILVRYFNLPRIDNYLRISIGTMQDMELLCRTVEKILHATEGSE